MLKALYADRNAMHLNDYEKNNSIIFMDSGLRMSPASESFQRKLRWTPSTLALPKLHSLMGTAGSIKKDPASYTTF